VYLSKFLLLNRYAETVVVIGMNPSKVYDVSPNERASLVRKMVKDEFLEKKTNEITGILRGRIRVEGEVFYKTNPIFCPHALSIELISDGLCIHFCMHSDCDLLIL